MFVLAWLSALNALPTTKRSRIDSSNSKESHFTKLKLSKPKTITSTSGQSSVKISQTEVMYLGIWGRIFLLACLLGIGCYALDKEDETLSELRDFKYLKNVIEASAINPCSGNDLTSRKQRRSKRHADSLPGPACLDETNPIYYVSKYHREVCHSSVELAYEIFYGRTPEEDEFVHWFERCISREIDEAYMMWKFAESDEHMEFLERKRDLVGDGNDSNRSVDHTGEEEAMETDEPLAVPMKMRLTNQEFTEDLNDPESDEFQELADNCSHALADVLSDVDGLTGVKVLGFGNGSLIVFYELIFDDEVKTMPEVFGEDEDTFGTGDTAFDAAKFAEKVKDKVKDVIKEALTNPEVRANKLSNTILSDAHIDLESLETIPQDVVDEFVKLNPSAPVVTVDLTTHNRTEDTDHLIDTSSENIEDVDTLENDSQDDTERAFEGEFHAIIQEVTASTPTENPEETTEILEITTTSMLETNALIEESGEENSSGVDGEDDMVLNEESTTEQTDVTATEDNSSLYNEAEYLDSLDDEGDYFMEYDYDDSEDNTDDESDTNAAGPTPETSTGENASASNTASSARVGHNVTSVANDSAIQVASPPDIEDISTTNENSVNGTNEENPLPEEALDALSQTVVMKLRVTNMNYTRNLTDRESEEFQVLAAKFSQILKPLLQSMDGFLDMEVLGFSYGSLIVNNELHFKDNAPDNVKEEVKGRISAAARYFKYAHVAVDPEATEVLSSDEADVCEFVQCHLYADCKLRNDYRTECICRPGYISVNPANCVSLCDLEPGFCRNGGECHVVPGRGAVCRCKVSFNWGYQGERCEEAMPRSVLLVSTSTGVACVGFMLLVAGSAYFFYRRKRNIREERKAKELEDKDFMRAAQIMSRSKTSSDSDRVERINPMFVTEEESLDDIKDISTSSCPSPQTSTSSMNKSFGSTSTSSFFVKDKLDNNGPLPGDMNTPERRILHLQMKNYPDHRETWCGEKNEKQKMAYRKMRARISKEATASVKSH